MNRKQKKVLARIMLAAVLIVALELSPVMGRMKFFLFMIPYLVIGYDILKKACRGILNRQVFDENFLMAAATVGAIALGEYTEGVAVMLFYQIGELFQSYAVGKSRKNISDLMDICPDYANVEVEGKLVQVAPDEVEIGTVILVQPGEKIPIDGVMQLTGCMSCAGGFISGTDTDTALPDIRDIVNKAFQQGSTVMRTICIPKADIYGYRHPKLQCFPYHIINSLHKFCCSGKTILSWVPQFYHQKITSRGNSGIPSVTVPSIARSDSGNSSPMPGSIDAWDELPSVCQYGLLKRFVDLFCRVFRPRRISRRRSPAFPRSKRLIPQSKNPCGSVLIAEICIFIVYSGIDYAYKNILTK